MELELFVYESALVKPGQNICKYLETVRLGPGLYEENGFVKAGKLGKIQLKKSDNVTFISLEDEIINAQNLSKRHLQLQLGDLVLARIKKLNENSAKVEILAINNNPVAHNFEGTIKKENMRSSNIDSIKVDEICYPNDIVICKVKSLNESKNILLTIEADGLGVILSKSETGNVLIPLSKERMQSPTSKKVYSKKVARLKEDSN